MVQKSVSEFLGQFPTVHKFIDCEQSLSFPNVFLAFLSAIKQQAVSGKAVRSAGAEEKEKERDCGDILIFSICHL